jgi:hypothetical protein
MRPLGPTLAIVFALLACTPALADDIAWAPLATSVTALVSDGDSAAAYMPSADSVRVLLADGTDRTLAAPAGCSALPNRSDGGLVAVGGGYLLYVCRGAGSPGDLVVQAIATGRYRTVAGQATLTSGEDGSGPLFYAVGAYWLGGHIANHVGDLFLMDLQWRTGVQFGFPRHTLGRHQIEALDTPRLRRPLCAPLRRRGPTLSHGGGRSSYYLPLAYEPPWAAEVTEGSAGARARLALRRCGSARARTLDRGPVSQLQGGGGVFTWVVPNGATFAVKAYSTAKRRTVAWSTRDFSLNGQHLGGRVFASLVTARVGGGNLTPTAWAIAVAEPFR